MGVGGTSKSIQLLTLFENIFNFIWALSVVLTLALVLLFPSIVLSTFSIFNARTAIVALIFQESSIIFHLTSMDKFKKFQQF